MLGYEGILSRLNSLPKEQQDSLLTQTTESVGQCFIPSPGPQTAAFYSPASLLLYGGGAGGGKLIRLNEKLVTPTGFTLMGDIKVGDTVIDKDGLPCNVTAVSDINPSPELWKFTFDDKTEVVSCIDHQWLTYSAKELGDLLKRDTSWKANRRANRPSRAKEIKTKSEKFYAALLKRNQTIKPEPLPLPTGSVHTTREIINSLTVHAKKRSNHAIPLCVAPDFPEQELLVPPYTLGAWLGDGTSASGGFTGIDPEIWERIEEDGYEVSHGKGLDAEKRHHILGLSPQLREIGVLNNKHIPIQYLRGSRTQRITLLQGLMDTDGTVARCSGSAEFCNTNEAIIDGVYELICSLGWKVNKREGRAKLYGRDCGAKWTLKFLPDDYVFYLPRKRKIQGIAKRQSQKFRYIESAIKVESEAGRCITVDSPSSTYLISSSFLPTHNSKLIIGLALTAHRASLIMRRKKADSTSLQEDTLKTYGSRDGYNGSNTPSLRTKDGRFIEFGGCENIGDEQSYQGRAHGLKAFDEVTQFNENQVKYIMGWNRTADPLEVRCRTVFASNPPISTQGDWIIGMFRPWLDVTHENPAKDGELRWFITDNRDNEIEVPDSNPIEDGYDITGKKQYIIPKSRTFIRSLYTDNPYLASDYKSTLDSLPSVFRAAMRDGDFMMARKDTEGQIIPTAWIRAAQERWTDKLPVGVPMCAIGVDPAAGGEDNTVLAPRYDGYYPKFIKVKGADTPFPQDVAGLVIRFRRDAALPIIDCGGGYGGGVVRHLQDNGIVCRAFNGVNTSMAKTADRMHGFANKRTEAYFKFAEALDPSQPGGSTIALPPSVTLLSDLASGTYKVKTNGDWQMEAKADIKKRIGRSPDEGDACVMAWTAGASVETRGDERWDSRKKPKAVMGYANRRR